MFKILAFLCISFHIFCAEAKYFIGISGGSGSGKTTLAQKIQEKFPKYSLLISQDAYYKDLSHLPLEERAKTNFDHPSAIDFCMLKEHLIALKNNCSIYQPIYNFQTHSREKETKLLQPAEIVVVEGILLLAIPEIRDLLDLKIYIDTDNDVRILRRMERDMNERARSFIQVKEQYFMTVKPMHEEFVAPSRQYADVIFPWGGLNQKALEIIFAKIKEGLELIH